MGKPPATLNASAEVAVRFREILPPDFAVEADETGIRLLAPDGRRVLRAGPLAEHRIPPEQVLRHLRFLFGVLPKVMSGFPEASWPAAGLPCFADAFGDGAHVWYGPTDDEDAAVLRVRPFPWAVFGLSRRDFAIRLRQCM